MATSPLEICNSALAKLGAELITSLSDDTKSAKLCNAQYAKLRDEVLRTHPWNFAIFRASLAASVTPPAFGYKYSYPLPTDCLRVLPPEDGSVADYEIEGRAIVTDSASMQIKYIKQVADTTLFDINFSESLAWRIAWDLCYAITQSSSQVEECKKSFLFAIAQARSFDAQEGGRIRTIEAQGWLNSRY